MLSNWISNIILRNLQPRVFVSHGKLNKISSPLLVDLYDFIFSRSQYFSPESLEMIQRRRLEQIIDRARSSNAFYGEYLKNISTVKDFFSLKPITKETLRNASDCGLLRNEKLKEFAIPQDTSGSTGVPLSFFLDKNMLARRRAIYRRMLSWIGKTDEDFVVLLMPRHHPGLESEALLFQCGSPVQLEKDFGKLCSILENKSVILQSRASHLVRLAQILEKNVPKISFKAVISYTEELHPPVRDYLVKILDAPVFNYYASNEITAIGQECEIREGFHINSEWVLVEVVGKDCRPLPAGERGDIVITSFDNEVFPFIRYKIGDRGYWIKESCSCGRTLPRLEVEGRDIFSFLLPNGQAGYFYELIYPIAKLISKIKQYQVIRHAPHRFTIRIVPGPAFQKGDHKLISDKFREYIGSSVDVTILPVKEIERPSNSKHVSFINLHKDHLQ